MTLERAAAGCIFAAFDGVVPPPWLLGWCERGLGGVVLFGKNVGDAEQVRALTDALHAARAELVVATDEEGGDVTRLEAATGSSYPGNAALGAVDDVGLTEEVAAAIGADLAAAGVDLDFAPVADVNSNPANPVIGIRSFGSDPEHVARHVAAFARGLQHAGVAACAKHFPGHGDTAVDSHLDLPTISADREAFTQLALPPFAAAIDTGVSAIMTAHIRVDSFDAVPATLSRAVLTDLLRGELGFDGAVITDALEMRAIAAGVGIEEGAVLALAAGADALCLGAEVDDAIVARVHAAIVAAVRDGRLAETRVHDAASRVAALTAPRVAPVGEARRDAGREAAERALTVEGELALAHDPLVVELAPPPSIAAGPARHTFAQLLRARVQETDVLRIAPGGHVDLDHDRQIVIVVRDAHRHEWERALVATVARNGVPPIVIETGVPLWRPPGSAAYVATYGGGRVNLEAAADALARAQRPASSAGATPRT